MANYPPPTEFLPIFNSEYYDFSSESLTIETGDERYLRLSGGIVSGNVLFNAGIQSTSNILINTGYSLYESNNNKITFNSNNIDFLINNISVFNLTSAGPVFSLTNLDLATTGYLGNGGNERVQFSSSSIDLQTNGTSKLLIDGSNITFSLPVILPNAGSITNGSGESIIFSTSSVDLQIGSVSKLLTTATDSTFNNNVSVSGVLTLSAGSQGVPAIAFTLDSNTGIYNPDIDTFAIACGGDNALTLTSSLLTLPNDITLSGTITTLDVIPTGRIYSANGTVSLPAITFNSDGNTGIYRIGADNLGIACAGVNAFNLTSTLLTLNNLTLTGTTLTLPATGIIANGSNESLTFSSTDIQLKTNNVTRLTIADSTITSSPQVSITNTTDASSSVTGALICSGGVGCAKKLYVGDTTDASSSTIGAVVCSGGLAVAKKIYIGTSLNFTSGTNPSALSVYDEISSTGNDVYSTGTTSLCTIALSQTIRVKLIGNTVFVWFSRIAGTVAGTTAIATSAYVIPSAYRPISNNFNGFLLVSNGGNVQGTVRITNAGIITFYSNNIATGTFTSGASFVLEQICVSYTIA